MHLSAAVPAPWRGFWDRFAFPPSESAEESRAFREHLLSSFWAGTSGGVFLLTDVILAKTLNATGWQMTLMASLGPIASLMSFAWVGLVTGKRRGSSFFLAALLGKIPIVLVLVFKTATYMVFMTFLSSLIGALMMTGTNSIYQACYSEKTRAHRYALATSVGTVFSILSAQVSGAILERNERVWPYLFVISALMSLLAVYHTYRMDVASGDRRDARAWLRMGAESLRSSVRTRPHFEPAGVGRSFGDAVRISRENPEFFRFEMNFMVYGIAFLAILPIFPLYIVNELKMNYTQLSATKGVWSQAGQMVLSPLLGILLVRMRPMRFTGQFFLLLMLYPLCILASTFASGDERIAWVWGAVLLFSVAMAGVNLSWNMSSIYFAGEADAATFQGLHIAMTGVRGLFAPALGYFLYAHGGTRVVFSFSTALFAVAAWMMFAQEKRTRQSRLATEALERGAAA